MCLAVPAKIVELEGARATVEVPGNRFAADVSLVPGVTLGDYVLVHAGFAIERYTAEDAEEILKIYEDMSDAK
ncbi:MAG TPA: HypC/HybG/HupF family hydrogenase formation chaperone [Planctomycetota bacterium]|nr:HypC/HybG/HupF family hydrogenase formation chaperone [Planctomycetota bacterium]